MKGVSGREKEKVQGEDNAMKGARSWREREGVGESGGPGCGEDTTWVRRRQDQTRAVRWHRVGGHQRSGLDPGGWPGMRPDCSDHLGYRTGQKEHHGGCSELLRAFKGDSWGLGERIGWLPRGLPWWGAAWIAITSPVSLQPPSCPASRFCTLQTQCWALNTAVTL